jgi:hypothetical protein
MAYRTNQFHASSWNILQSVSISGGHYATSGKVVSSIPDEII